MMTGEYRQADLHDPEKCRNPYLDPKVDGNPLRYAFDEKPEKGQEEKFDWINNSPNERHPCVPN